MFRKQIVVPILVLGMSFIACNSPDEQPGDVQTDRLPEMTRTEDSASRSRSPLVNLQEYSGQYPSDVQLFDDQELNNRIRLLLGEDYANFRKFWQTETPILMEDEVLFTTGCEQHNCAANQYILQIDLKHDNVNIFHIGSDFKSYAEKGPIHLPPGLAKEFLIIKGNTTVSI